MPHIAEICAPPAEKKSSAGQEAKPVPAAASGINPAKLWIQILEQLEAINRGAFFRLEYCRLLRQDNRELLLEFPADREDDYRYFSRDKALRELLQKTVYDLSSANWSIMARLGEFTAPELADEESEPASSPPGGEETPEASQQSLF